ncbi:uncharacterized protein [Periplaneta americana]|uniref:uncharacterized protein isoform X2 n=1 Tax=Periplaneta americana TaxID=6978 RepID=UPI0037E7BE66
MKLWVFVLVVALATAANINIPRNAQGTTSHENNSNSVNVPLGPQLARQVPIVPENKHPTLTFKRMLRPSQNIQDYYQKIPSELDNVRFLCRRISEENMTFILNWRSYECHHNELPLKLRLEIPSVILYDDVIDAELSAPYSAIANDAWNDIYTGISVDELQQDLLEPNAIGIGIRKAAEGGIRTVWLPVAVLEDNQQHAKSDG